MKLCIYFGYVNKMIISLKFTPVCFSSSYFINGMTRSQFKNFLPRPPPKKKKKNWGDIHFGSVVVWVVCVISSEHDNHVL